MTLFLVLILCLVLAAGWFLIPFGLRQLSSARLRRYCRDQKAIVLSYDDGPSADLIRRLLDLLAERDTKATFFLLGRNVEAHSEEMPRLLASGHELGSHTFDHSNAWKVWPWHASRDLADGVRCLRSQGLSTQVFRPPYGKSTLVTLVDCWWRGQRVGWWTIDTQDTWDRRSIAEVLDDIKAQNGGVVMMHDLDGLSISTPGMPHADYVLELTRSIIDLAAKRGLRIRRLGDVYAEAAG